MAGNGFGKRGVASGQSVPTPAVEPEIVHDQEESNQNNRATGLILVGLIAASIAFAGVVGWMQKDIISAKISGWTQTVQAWRDGPSDKKTFAYDKDSYGSYSVLGAGARIARLAMIDYDKSPLQDPEFIVDNPRKFIKSYNYDVFVKATKLYAMADACHDRTARALAIAVIKVSTGRSQRNIAKLGRILRRGSKKPASMTERDCKKRVPDLFNELMGMV